MKHLPVVAILTALALFMYFGPKAEVAPEEVAALPSEAPAVLYSERQQFSCDGRTRCSQMSSCAEATYFINYCPNTEMDGNHDGVPCERQWCN